MPFPLAAINSRKNAGSRQKRAKANEQPLAETFT